MSNSPSEAEYSFLPWVREGYVPETQEQLQSPIDAASQLAVELDVRGEDGDDAATETAKTTLDMYGPGDVTGLDRRQVVRMEPEPKTHDFTPNYFPMIEFDRADLPWLFSPLQADGDGKLRPWICLVVVEQRDGVDLETSEHRPLPVLTIGDDVDPSAELPDPTDAWAWAHTQVVGDSTDVRAVGTGSTKTRSRLVAPRRLEPDTSYHACVVPTFEPGRRAGLGQSPYPDDGRSADVGMAWNHGDPPDAIALPVYHSWSFKTGEQGDFESLARLLDPELLDDVGYRDVDASQPGVPALETVRRPADVRMEGALRSTGLDELDYPDERRETFRALLNDELDADGDDRPTFGPPIYGQYHADRERVPADPGQGGDGASTWFRQLNLDPANRVAASFGSAVVREHQESLMASAWDQVGEVRAANRLLRQAQLSRAASSGLHEHVSALESTAVLALSEPMHERAVWADEDRPFADAVEHSRLPETALSPALRRLVRPNGFLADRVDGDLPGQAALVGALNAPDGSPERPGAPDGTLPLYRADGTLWLYRTERQAVCTGLGTMPDPNADLDQRPFGDRLDDVEPESLLDSLWRDCMATDRTVEQLREAVGDGADRALVSSLREATERICVERGGQFDEERNLLAGLEESVESGGIREVATFLARAARAKSAACEQARELRRLAAAGQLSGGDPAVVERLADQFLEHCQALRDALALLAALHLDSICALAHQTVPERDDVPIDGPAGDRIEEVLLVCEAVCGEDDQNGLVRELLSELRSGHDAEETSRALLRWLAVARDHLNDAMVQREFGQHAEPLSRACGQVTAIVRLVADAIGSPAPNPIRDRLSNTFCASPEPEPSPDPVLNVDGMADAVVDALDPEVAIPRRVADRIGGAGRLLERDDPAAVLLEEPDFPRPMYEPLAELSREHLLPGIGTIPPDSIGLLESNPEFIESFMFGANHEMARELRWREYPTDMRGTYFSRFWGAEGAVPPRPEDDRADVEDIHDWGTGADAAPLGENLTGSAQDSDVVAMVRGELLRRYPNTAIYLAKAVAGPDGGDERVPAVSSGTAPPDPEHDFVTFPQFRGTLDPDIHFLGFNLSAEEAISGSNGGADGWFVVIEEAPGEPRLGLDVNQGDVGTVPDGISTQSGGSGSGGDESGWSALSWGHMVPDEGEEPLSELTYVHSADAVPGADGWTSTEPDAPEWGKNGGHMAAITWQKPVRIAIHADDLLPADAAGGGS